MTTHAWIDGRSLLAIEEDGDRRRISIHNLDEHGEICEHGWTFTAGPDRRTEVADVLRVVVPYPTRPEDYRRDQFDPADEEGVR